MVPGLPVDPDTLPEVLPPHRRPLLLAAVALGGALGAAARYAFSLHVTPAADGFPTATFLINLSGCFLLGLLVALLARRARPGTRVADYGRAFLGSGVLGAWTTYSAFGVETDLLVHHRHAGVAVAYVLASVAGGIVLAAAGIAAGERWP